MHSATGTSPSLSKTKVASPATNAALAARCAGPIRAPSRPEECESSVLLSVAAPLTLLSLAVARSAAKEAASLAYLNRISRASHRRAVGDMESLPSGTLNGLGMRSAYLAIAAAALPSIGPTPSSSSSSSSWSLTRLIQTGIRQGPTRRVAASPGKNPQRTAESDETVTARAPSG